MTAETRNINHSAPGCNHLLKELLQKGRGVFIAVLLMFFVSKGWAQFTPGNVVVYRVGDGAASLTTSATVVFLDEYTPGGFFVQSVPLPIAVNGLNRALTASGVATSEGLITLSVNGEFILATGYDAAPGTPAIAATSAAAYNRVVGLINFSEFVMTTTALNDAYSYTSGNNNIRSATSINGSSIWTGGTTSDPTPTSGGVRFCTLLATTSTQLSTDISNIRAVNIFNGQLYNTDAVLSPPIRLGTVGTGLPTASGQTITNLPGFPTSGGSPYAFYFADLNASVPGVDVLYVADETAGITKYSFVSGSWISNGTVGVDADDYRGVTGRVSGTNVTLFATRGGGEIVTLPDVSGYNGAFAGSPASLASAASNRAFRGIAFTPIEIPIDITPNTNVNICGTGVLQTININSTVNTTINYAITNSTIAGLNNSTGGNFVSGGPSNSASFSFTPTSPGTATVTSYATYGDKTTALNTFTITVTAPVLPTFTQVGPFCQGTVQSGLPTTSNNGFTGTWNPGSINTGTTGTSIYTFTPDAGQCATLATMSIEITSQILPTFTQVGPLCQGSPSVTLLTSSTNSSPIIGVWSPATVSTTTPGTTTYTFTPDPGQCATPTTMSVVITGPIPPTFAAIGPLCHNSAQITLPSISTNSINGSWNPNSGVINPNTIGTTLYTFTPTIGQCATTATMNIVVAAQVPTIFTPIGPLCQNSIPPLLPPISNNGFSGTWNTTINTSVAGTTGYIFSPASGVCATTISLDIVIIPQVVPTFAPIAPICSGGTLSPLPTLSTNIPGITGTWLPALDNTTTTTYTFTPTAGQCATPTTLTITVNPSVTPTFNAVAPICSGGTLLPLPTSSTNIPAITGIWSPALNNTATTTYTFTPDAGQCATTATLTITVNPNVTPTFNAVAPICSGGALLPLPTLSTNIPAITGTWLPALDNTTTTTYTFTPNAGQCATPTTLTITVNPIVTPTFNAVAPICSGGTLSPLPTSSTNIPAITGTWLPALNNTATTTYTFTPAAGQCATPTTLTITVNPSVTPTFNAVAPICSGETLSPLPTSSTNIPAITGTWLPALNNTTTTTYTFTPNGGQCATPTTLTITVNPSITPTFNAVAPICSGGTLLPLSTTSTNIPAITGTWLPALDNTTTTTYTFTPNAGQCAAPTTLTIIVNPSVTPTFNPVAPICSGGTLLPLPTTSTNIPAITGTWLPALDNTTTTTYTFTPNAGQCAIPTTLTITVNPIVTPTFNAVAPICSGETLSPLPTTSTNIPAITGTWLPAMDNTTTTTYTFTPNAGQCATPTTLTINVNPSVTTTFNAVAPICSGETLSPLPTSSTNIPAITGTWSPALDNTTTTTYTFTPTAGQCATQTTLTITVNPSVTPTFNAVAPICSGGILLPLPTTSTNIPAITGTWLPALNNTATITYTFTPNAGQCATPTTLTIVVNPIVTPLFNTVAPVCTGAAITALPLVSLNGITGTWSPALDNTTTITYTFTPDAGQCATQTTLTIVVNPTVTPVFNAVAPICSGATLTALPLMSLNGILGTWSPALDNTTTITYTFTPDAGQCATQATLTIVVNPTVTPVFNAVAPICSGATMTALPLMSLNGILGTWSPALDNTTTITYTFTPDAGQCATQATLTIVVNPTVTPVFNAVAPICSGATLTALPLMSLNGILGTWSPALDNTTTITYTFTPDAGQCATQATLTIVVNPTVTPVFNTIAPVCSGATITALPLVSLNSITGTWSPALDNTTTITYTFTPDAGQCATQATLTIVVNPTVTPVFNSVAPICSGATLTALPLMSLNGILGTWSPALDNTTTITYTFTPDAGQCATQATLTIVVNPTVTPVFNAVAPICSGDPLSSLPISSTNIPAIIGSWTPALNNTATTTYTFIPDAGQCASSTTLTIPVNPIVTPTFNAIAPICSGDPLSPLPTSSTNTPAIIGSWTPALNNTATTTYTFIPDAGQCASSTTLTITVNPVITPTFNAIAPICSGGTLLPLPTSSTNTPVIIGSWSPALNNTTTTTYTFIPDAGQCASSAVLTITINPTPTTPTGGTITHPTCTVATGSVIINNLPTGNWTINPGGITGNTVSTTITGLAAGTYNYTVTNAAGCTSVPSANIIINAQPALPAIPVHTIDCSLGSGNATITITSPTGAGLEYSLDGGTYQTSTTFTGVANGSHSITVRNAAGCTTTGSIFPVSCGCTNGPSVTLSSITGSVCGTAPVTVSGNTFTNATTVTITENGAGSVSPASISASPFTFTYTPVAGDAGNTVTITLTTDNPSGPPCAAAVVTYALIVNATPATPTVGTITQPTCAIATGSVELNNLPAGNWVINPGAIAGTGTSTIISGLATGTYTYTVTNAAGCTSLASANIVIDAQPASPPAPTVGTITQPTCAVATGSVVINNLPTGNWIINPGGIAGNTVSTTIMGLVAGTYTYTVTNAAGCTSVASANIVINAQPSTPTAPAAGTIAHPTCTVATGSVVLNNLPAGNWIINPGAIAGNTLSTTITGLVSGTYSYTVTNAAGCTSVASTNIIINAQPATPPAPTLGAITQPTCTVATGSVVLNNLPAGSWIINPGAITGNTISTTITGLVAGTYSYTVTNAAGCISVVSTNIIINAQSATPPAPTAGAITQPTCTVATGSVVLNNLPAGNWIINPGGITGNTSSTTITGLAAGTYSYTVTNAAGCTSVTSANIVIDAQPTLPAIPVHTTDCSLGSGNATVTVTSPTGTGLEYSLDGGTYQTSTTFTGVANGSHTITVRNAAGCTATGNSFTVSCGCANGPAITLSSISGNTCGTSPVTISGNTFTNATTVTITENGAGSVSPSSVTTSPFSFTYTPVAGDIGNTVIITLTSNNPLGSPCAAAVVTYTLSVNAAPVVSAGSNSPLCEGSTLTLTSTPAGASLYSWTGPNVFTASSQNPTITNVTVGVAGTYNVTATNANGCSSVASTTVVINPSVTPTFTQVGPLCQNSTAPALPTSSTNTPAIIGTWSPATINTAATGTTTYTFTPGNSQCASATTMDIVITNSITPTFAQIGPLCQNSTAPALPTGSTNTPAITGTWNPATTNTATVGTTTYTFTPATGQCASIANMDIVITNSITPTFAQIGPLCQNSTAPALPTSSTNTPAITGTWSPATINTGTVGTTTYTFTPATGQCASIATMDIVIANSITPTFTQIGPLCQNSTAPALPASSTNTPAITGTWNPATINTSTVGTTTYTFTPATGQCAATATMNIVITNSITPTFTQIGPLCQNSPAPALPASSTNTPGITGTWNPATINTSTVGTTTYTFTPATGQCAATATMDIVITNSITPTFTQIGPLCQNSTAPALPTSSTNTPAITGTWSPATINTGTVGTATYTFTPATGQCAAIATMDIFITNSITPTFAQIGPLCQNSTAPALPTSSTNTPAITGSWNPATINTAAAGTTTYTFTPATGQCAATTMNIVITNSITPTFAQIGPLCQNSTAPALPTSSTNTPAITGTWNPAIINTSAPGTTTYTFTPATGQCAATATMSIVITNLITPTFAQIGPLCQNSTAPALPASSTNTPGITGTWNPATINTATVGTTTYTFTPATGQCAATATMNIVITNSIIPTFTQIGPLCQNSTAPALPTSSTNTPAITGTWSPATINTATAGTTTYTFTPATGQCAATATISIVITAQLTPTFTTIAPLCQNATAPALPATSVNGISGTWNPATIGTTTAGTTTYTFTPATGQCAATATMNIVITPQLIPTFTSIAPLCINSTAPLLPATSANGIAGTWSPATVSTVTAGTTTYTFTPTTGQCAAPAIMNVVVTAPIPAIRYTTITAPSNTATQFVARNIGVTYQWTPATGLSSATISNPVFNYNQQTEYTIRITSNAGCVTTDTLLVKMLVTKIDILVPKGWSPNGDGHNDKLSPITVNIRELRYFRIFNRWGQLVFETNTIGQGWDGMFKGQPQGIDTYQWIAEGIGNNGQVVKRAGNSVLIR